MEIYTIEVVENATNVINIMPETPLEKVVAECMKDYLEMRNLEERGLLLILPCRVGDEFWELNDRVPEPYVYSRIAHSISHVLYCKTNLGKTTFLTRERAETELRKMKGENNG